MKLIGNECVFVFYYSLQPQWGTRPIVQKPKQQKYIARLTWPRPSYNSNSHTLPFSLFIALIFHFLFITLNIISSIINLIFFSFFLFRKDLGLFLLFLTMCSNGCKEFAKVKCRRRRKQAARGAVEMKMKKLQSLVPGGEGLNPDRLFLRTADYILHLRLQVDVLQTLSKICKP